MEQLLIIEDDIGLNQGLSKALKADDRQIISCQDLKTAKAQLLCGGVSLILLDINLPDGSGLELLREIKENTPGIPVILLTANDTDLDIVDGLERGADDYITKPFNILELKARIKAILRRTSPEKDRKNASVIESGNLRIDRENRRLSISGREINLTSKEFELLDFLVSNPGKVYSRTELLHIIWGKTDRSDERTVDVHVRRLREKIEPNPSEPVYVQTKWGVGYFYQEHHA